MVWPDAVRLAHAPRPLRSTDMKNHAMHTRQSRSKKCPPLLASDADSWLAHPRHPNRPKRLAAPPDGYPVGGRKAKTQGGHSVPALVLQFDKSHFRYSVCLLGRIAPCAFGSALVGHACTAALRQPSAGIARVTQGTGHFAPTRFRCSAIPPSSFGLANGQGRIVMRPCGCAYCWPITPPSTVCVYCTSASSIAM